MVKLDVAAYGAGLQNAMKSAPNGLYMTNGSAPLGKNTGLRQEYRWGVLNSCGYAKEGGVCNSTRFPVEFQPLETILSDTPMKFFIQWVEAEGDLWSRQGDLCADIVWCD
jgi:hypothetical protein